MRVGFNARYLTKFAFGGFSRYTFCLLKELQSHPEIELSLFTHERSPIHPKFLDHLRGQVIQGASPRALLWEQGRLPLQLRKRRMDIFHAPADGGLPVVKACKHVLTYQDAADRGLEDLIRRGYLSGTLADFLDVQDQSRWSGACRVWRHDVMRWLYLRRADVIITVSEYSKREIAELLRVRPEKIRVTHMAPDEMFRAHVTTEQIDAVRCKYGLPATYVLYVSSFDRRKNVDGLLHTFAELKREGIPEGLVLIGSGGDRERAEACAASLGLVAGRDVVFLERVHEELPAIYRGATLFMTLAWKETFCLPVVEAMAAGRPVVASSTGCLPEIVADGGILVDPRDTRGIVAVVKALLGNRELREMMGARALARAGCFSWSRLAEETVQIYRDLLRQPGG